MTDSEQVFPDLIRTAIDQARQTALQIDGLRAANARTIRTLETVFNRALNGPSYRPASPAPTGDRRTKIQSRIEADAALRSFILARIMTLSFDQVLAEAAAHFPPDRVPSRSALHRWWHRYGKTRHRTAIGNS